MTFRKATEADLDQMMAIAMAGKAFLKAQGVDQWQTEGYPSREIFEADIEKGQGYVLEEDGQIMAVSAVIFGEDPSYNEIEGAWLNDQHPYITTHRCAVAEQARGKGVMGLMFDHAAALGKALGAYSLRVDTHADNKMMQHAVAKAGFTKCGIIILAEGAEKGKERLSYERML